MVRLAQGIPSFWPKVTMPARRSISALVTGLRYAFPEAMKRLERRYPRVMALQNRVENHPRLATYLGSKRRIPFNEMGIFRAYPELDR